MTVSDKFQGPQRSWCLVCLLICEPQYCNFWGPASNSCCKEHFLSPHRLCQNPPQAPFRTSYLCATKEIGGPLGLGVFSTETVPGTAPPIPSISVRWGVWLPCLVRIVSQCLWSRSWSSQWSLHWWWICKVCDPPPLKAWYLTSQTLQAWQVREFHPSNQCWVFSKWAV